MRTNKHPADGFTSKRAYCAAYTPYSVIPQKIKLNRSSKTIFRERNQRY